MILAGRILVERCPRSFDERSQPRHPSPARRIFLFNSVIALLFKSGTPSGNLHAANAFQSWFSIVFCLFSLASVASLARTRTELGARVDACKWNGRGRRQNSGKLKLMNNRSPCSPVCSPSELSYASQRRNRWKTVEEQRGMWLRWKRRYNDDTAGRGGKRGGSEGKLVLLFFSSCHSSCPSGTWRPLSYPVTGDKCFFNEFPREGILFCDELCRRRVTRSRDAENGCKLFRNLFGVCAHQA